MVNFFAGEARPMGRNASGVKGIDLAEGEKVIGVTTQLGGNKILVLTDKGYGKMTDVQDEEGNQIYRLTKRGAKGVSTLKVTDKVGKLVAVRAVNGDEDLMVITNAGIVIRTHLDQIRTIGRNTQGVKIMNLEGRQKVVSIAIVTHEDDVSDVDDADIDEEVTESIDENSEE